MHGLQRLTALSAILAAALATSIAPASAATTTTRWVDGDGKAGPNGCNSSASAARKIQTAISNSNTDDRVIVCPGTYAEQLVISGNRDGLTLQSSTPFGAEILAPTTLTGPFEFGIQVLVDRVDDVTIKGFKVITRTSAPCDNVGAAIAVSGSRRAAIRGNRVMAPGTVGGDCAQLDGIIAVDSLYGDSGIARSTSATIGYNEVRDAVFIGIGAGGTDREVSADIVHNSVRAYFGNQPVKMPAAAGVGDFPFSEYGIGIFGRFKGSIQYNVVQGSTTATSGGAVFVIGIGADGTENSQLDPFTNGPIDIHHNLVRRVYQGLDLRGVDQVTVRSNEVRTTLVGLTGNLAVGNTIRNNQIAAQGVGIDVDSDTVDNVFRNNTVTGSGGYCDDESSGGGTSGTGNQWIGNTATQGSDPTGICVEP